MSTSFGDHSYIPNVVDGMSDKDLFSMFLTEESAFVGDPMLVPDDGFVPNSPIFDAMSGALGDYGFSPASPAQLMPDSPLRDDGLPVQFMSSPSSYGHRDSSPEALMPPPPARTVPQPLPPLPAQAQAQHNPLKRKRSVKTYISKEEILDLASKGLPAELVKEDFTEEEERDLKRQRRLIKNRESAHNSRQRKKEYMSTVEQQLQGFADENERLKKKVEELENCNKQLNDEVSHMKSLLRKAGLSTGVSGLVDKVNSAMGKFQVNLNTGGKAAVCLMVVLFSFGLLFRSSATPVPFERIQVPDVVPSAMGNRIYVGKTLHEFTAKEEYENARAGRVRSGPSRVYHREAPMSVIEVQKKRTLATRDDINRELAGQPGALEAVKQLQTLIDTAQTFAAGGKPVAAAAVATPTKTPAATATEANSTKHAIVVTDGDDTPEVAAASPSRNPDAYVYCPAAQGVMTPIDDVIGRTSGDLPVVSFLIPSAAMNGNRTVGDGDDVGPMLQLTCQLLDVSIVPAGTPAKATATVVH